MASSAAHERSRQISAELAARRRQRIRDAAASAALHEQYFPADEVGRPWSRASDALAALVDGPIEDRLIQHGQHRQIELDARRREAVALAQFVDELSTPGRPVIGPPPDTLSNSVGDSSLLESRRYRKDRRLEDALQDWGIEKQRRRQTAQALAEALDDEMQPNKPKVSPGSRKLLAAKAARAVLRSSASETAHAGTVERLLKAGAARDARLAQQMAARDAEQRAKAERTAQRRRERTCGIGDRLHSASQVSEAKKAAAEAAAIEASRALATPPGARRRSAAAHAATVARMQADEIARQERLKAARQEVLAKRHAAPDLKAHIEAAKTTRQAQNRDQSDLCSRSSLPKQPKPRKKDVRLPPSRRRLHPRERIARWEELTPDERREAVHEEALRRRLYPESLNVEDERILFARWDINGNGVLSMAEIDKAVQELFPYYNHKPSVMRAYKAADLNGSGAISRHEFKKLLHFLVYFTELWEVFDQLDSDHDHRISRSEFAKASQKVPGLRKLDPAVLAAEFDRIDADGGGMVLFDEFCAWCAHYHIKDTNLEDPEQDSRAAELSCRRKAGSGVDGHGTQGGVAGADLKQEVRDSWFSGSAHGEDAALAKLYADGKRHAQEAHEKILRSQAAVRIQAAQRGKCARTKKTACDSGMTHDRDWLGVLQDKEHQNSHEPDSDGKASSTLNPSDMTNFECRNSEDKESSSNGTEADLATTIAALSSQVAAAQNWYQQLDESTLDESSSDMTTVMQNQHQGQRHNSSPSPSESISEEKPVLIHGNGQGTAIATAMGHHAESESGNGVESMSLSTATDYSCRTDQLVSSAAARVAELEEQIDRYEAAGLSDINIAPLAEEWAGLRRFLTDYASASSDPMATTCSEQNDLSHPASHEDLSCRCCRLSERHSLILYASVTVVIGVIASLLALWVQVSDK